MITICALITSAATSVFDILAGAATLALLIGFNYKRDMFQSAVTYAGFIISTMSAVVIIAMAIVSIGFRWFISCGYTQPNDPQTRKGFHAGITVAWILTGFMALFTQLIGSTFLLAMEVVPFNLVSSGYGILFVTVTALFCGFIYSICWHGKRRYQRFAGGTPATQPNV